MRKRASMGAAIVAASVAAAMLVASGMAATPEGGKVELWASADNNGSQHVVLVGAIGDYGKAVNVNKNGKPNPNGNFVRVKLQKGTFMLDSTDLNKAMNAQTQPQVESHATCSAAASGSGPVTFLNGTGLYKGISGTANLTITYGGIGGRYKSGPKKGQCKQGNVMNPRASFGFVTGQGTVSFAA